MPTLEERMAFLEGRVDEHSRQIDGIREALQHLEARMDRRFEAIDRRFEAIDARFTNIESRFDVVDRHFMWLVGLQVTTLVAIVAALLAR